MIAAESFEMEKMLKAVAQKLNLKPHYVCFHFSVVSFHFPFQMTHFLLSCLKFINVKVKEASTQKLKLVHGPVDIEGHQGRDGRFYVVDTGLFIADHLH
jgi:hypothetical protein